MFSFSFATSLLDWFMSMIGSWRNPCLSFPHSFATDVDHSGVASFGFHFSFTTSTKSAAVLFTRKHDPVRISLILRDGTRLQVKNEYKYLGLTFQRNRSYSKHVQNVAAKCRARLNVIRMLKGTSWVAGERSLLTVYRSLVRSVIEYGMEAYFLHISQSTKTITQDPKWCTEFMYWSHG